MASLDELGAGNPLDDMDEGHITQMCGFRANTPSRSEDCAGGMSEDRVQNAAMAQAMNEIATITSAAVNQRPKLTRKLVKDIMKHSCAARGKAVEVLDGPGPVCFAVIHAKSAEQVLQNVQVALDEGVAGVFIINHDFDYPEMLPILRQVRGCFPDCFLGANFHMVNGVEAFPILGRLAREGAKIDAYWADNACIEYASVEQPTATAIAQVRQRSGWDGLYFGGTAFKNPKQHPRLCQPVPTEHLTDVASAASQYMDVVTTSGPESGVAPDLQKISLMRAGCLDVPLCVASGIAPDNVANFFEDVDIVFAASSIQQPHDPGSLVASRLRALLAQLRGVCLE